MLGISRRLQQDIDEITDKIDMIVLFLLTVFTYLILLYVTIRRLFVAD